MAVRFAEAYWKGTLKEGEGTMKSGSGAVHGPYSFGTRFEESRGTNPEELLGAAHAGCFSMAFSLMLEEAGYPPENVETKADVHLEKVDDGFGITKIVLHTDAAVPKIEESEFQSIAEKAKSGCPVSKALAGVDIQLEAKLKG